VLGDSPIGKYLAGRDLRRRRANNEPGACDIIPAHLLRADPLGRGKYFGACSYIRTRRDLHRPYPASGTRRPALAQPLTG